MVEPAGDQSHAARPNITPRQELAREGLRDSSSLEGNKNTGLNWQSAILGRPRLARAAGDEVCLAGPGSVRPAGCKKCRQIPLF